MQAVNSSSFSRQLELPQEIPERLRNVLKEKGYATAENFPLQDDTEGWNTVKDECLFKNADIFKVKQIVTTRKRVVLTRFILIFLNL
jgi:ATP phosphoribosyltransferase regulatory subunit HisZ